MAERNRSCVLVILDGWGVRAESDGNAVAAAKTPCLDALFEAYPATRLVCSGEAVGLPEGIMGNSEVGHLNIGAGRIVFQDLLRIDRSVADGSFFRNDALLETMAHVRNRDAVLHLMGLVSDGGVHSQFTHLTALLDMARENGVKRTVVHAILDGRDTPPHSGIRYIGRLQEHIRSRGYGSIASLCGRYYAMDRDNRWDRIREAYRLYTLGEGVRAEDPETALESAYGREETDEFVRPVFLAGTEGAGRGIVDDGDGLVFFNFRADRAREITRAFTEPSFEPFERQRHPEGLHYVCMTLYDETFGLPVAYPPVHLEDVLGAVVSERGLQQLRIAETEKYAHVTYFLNGGREEPFPGEDRCLIPSPREVPTYDRKPEMSAREVTEEVLGRIRSDRYALVVLNFANMDMVGHTGDMAAAVKAVETVDGCVEQIARLLRERGEPLLITADHGNAEQMMDGAGGPHTAHTTNVVPLILVDERHREAALRSGGKLGDIAPTILALMAIQQPSSMTGVSLLSPAGGGKR